MASPRPASERHQQTTVTVERFALRTHQADTTPHRVGAQSLKSGFKFRLSGHGIIIDNAIAIERGIARAATERLAIGQIEHALLRQQRRKILC